MHSIKFFIPKATRVARMKVKTNVATLIASTFPCLKHFSKFDLVNKKFLKISTFKVSYTGNGIGNKYLSIIDVTAKKVGACLIYITVYPKLKVFIEFLKRHGYIVVGNYNKELVLVKKVKD